jgi:citrate/tricarballylate utilization protein
VFVFAAFALGVGVRRFLRREEVGSPSGAALNEAAHNALSLEYLDGGHGDGCNNADDAYSHTRRRFHHLTFYGFMLCFSATSVATLYHYVMGWPAPYGFTNPAQRPMDRGFIALLFLTAASGRLLMLTKGTAALPLALCVHLGCVMAFFTTMP